MPLLDTCGSSSSALVLQSRLTGLSGLGSSAAARCGMVSRPCHNTSAVSTAAGAAAHNLFMATITPGDVIGRGSPAGLRRLRPGRTTGRLYHLQELHGI